jgi:hypothetical protein
LYGSERCVVVVTIYRTTSFWGGDINEDSLEHTIDWQTVIDDSQIKELEGDALADYLEEATIWRVEQVGGWIISRAFVDQQAQEIQNDNICAVFGWLKFYFLSMFFSLMGNFHYRSFIPYPSPFIFSFLFSSLHHHFHYSTQNHHH